MLDLVAAFVAFHVGLMQAASAALAAHHIAVVAVLALVVIACIGWWRVGPR